LSNKLLLALTLSVIVVFCACQVKPAMQADAPMQPLDSPTDTLSSISETKSIPQNESFDPFLLPESELIFNPVNSFEMETEIDNPEELSVNEVIETEAVRVVLQDGYQVQLFASPDAAQAEEIKIQAMMLFPDHPVDMIWDAPNYKVRLGMFAIRDDAQELKRQALRLGYRDAWVVRFKSGSEN
jgi:hypothetical protein